MANVGALAANFHEGSRSEYLAQYVFASFGTAISVPHQSDTGVDLYCTLTERIGALAWPRHYFTVQVKSAMSPWKFGTSESVRWLVEHPLPLFFCVVDKATARLQVYHTLPRFLVWATGTLPDTLELVPEDKGQGQSTQSRDGMTFSLSAPILDRTVVELQDDTVWTQAKEILDFWLEAEKLNLARRTIGLPIFSMPDTYETNVLRSTGTVSHSSNLPGRMDDVRATLGDSLPWLAEAYHRQGDVLGMAVTALLLRHLFPEYERGGPSHAPIVQAAINQALRLRPEYVFEGVDLLGRRVDDLLNAREP